MSEAHAAAIVLAKQKDQMMSCYYIAQITIRDPEEYERYLDGTDEILAKYEATVLVVDDDPTVLEGSWPCTRTVVIRFHDESAAKQWYDSPEYQELARHRFRASSADAVLVRGRE